MIDWNREKSRCPVAMLLRGYNTKKIQTLKAYNTAAKFSLYIHNFRLIVIIRSVVVDANRDNES